MVVTSSRQEARVPEISASIPTSLKAELDEEISRSGRGISSVVTAALAQYLEKPVHTVFQVSTSGAPVAGVYDREVSVHGARKFRPWDIREFGRREGRRRRPCLSCTARHRSWTLNAGCRRRGQSTTSLPSKSGIFTSSSCWALRASTSNRSRRWHRWHSTPRTDCGM